MTDKLKTTIYIHANTCVLDDDDDKFYLSCSDLSEHGYPLLGFEEVEVSVPVKDQLEAELEMLGKQLAKVEQESFSAITAIKQKIRSLQAIEHKG